MAYNSIINPTVAYRHAVIEALISGRTLPSYQDNLLQLRDSGDTLLRMFAAQEVDIDALRAVQQERYGAIDLEVFSGVLAYVDQAAQVPIESEEVRTIIARMASEAYAPTQELFRAWHHIHEEAFGELIDEMNRSIIPSVRERTSGELVEVFTRALDICGLSDSGWSVAVSGTVNLVGVAASSRQVIVTERPVVMSRARFVGLVLHEVAVHALAAEHHERRDKDMEEGLGTLVEQLTLSQFYPLRLYRYLAICFAVGVDGTRRTAREVYDLLVPIRRALRPDESVEVSRRIVATELMRAYRALPTDIPGMAYLRDKKYIEYNARLWRTLGTEEPTLAKYQQLVTPWAENNG